MSFRVLFPLRFSPRYRTAAAVLSIGTTCLVGCTSRAGDSPSLAARPLEVDTIARVGPRILARTQLELAGLKGAGDTGRFVTGWINDALLAEGARSGLLEAARLRQVQRSVLARSLLEWSYERAKAAGEPTDSEIAKITAERWYEVDRPAAAVTSHFVVRVSAPESQSAAQKLARKIADAVRGITEPAVFVATAKALAVDGLQVTAESLPPMTADGRGLVLDKDGKPSGEGPTFDETYARAANALDNVGSQSGLLKTRFGFHVILLERRLAAYSMPIEDRRRQFASEIYSRRARQQCDRVIDEGKKRRPVQIQTSFQETIAQSQVMP